MLNLKSDERNQFIFGSEIASGIGQLVDRLNAAEKLEDWEKYFCRLYDSEWWELFCWFDVSGQVDYHKLTPELRVDSENFTELCEYLEKSFFQSNPGHPELVKICQRYQELISPFFTKCYDHLCIGREAAVRLHSEYKRLLVKVEKANKEFREGVRRYYLSRNSVEQNEAAADSYKGYIASINEIPKRFLTRHGEF